MPRTAREGDIIEFSDFDKSKLKVAWYDMERGVPSMDVTFNMVNGRPCCIRRTDMGWDDDENDEG